MAVMADKTHQEPADIGGREGTERDGIISDLIVSYNLQVELYTRLHDLSRKAYSQLVLTRGDLARVMGLFEEKQRLFNAINAERERIQPVAGEWQKIKGSVAPTGAAGRLNEVLSRVQDVISAFLDAEMQLEQYVRALAGRDNGVNT